MLPLPSSIASVAAIAMFRALLTPAGGVKPVTAIVPSTTDITSLIVRSPPVIAPAIPPRASRSVSPSRPMSGNTESSASVTPASPVNALVRSRPLPEVTPATRFTAPPARLVIPEKPRPLNSSPNTGKAPVTSRAEPIPEIGRLESSEPMPDWPRIPDSPPKALPMSPKPERLAPRVPSENPPAAKVPTKLAARPKIPPPPLSLIGSPTSISSFRPLPSGSVPTIRPPCRSWPVI